MNENIYAVYDLRAHIILKPVIIERNDVTPVRQFTELTNNKDTLFYKNPEDFHIMQIGTINLETGEVTQTDFRIVANASELKRAEP